MFGWEFPPAHTGGLGVACEGMVRGLLQHGTRVTLVLPHDATESAGNLQILSPLQSEELEVLAVESRLRPYDDAETFVRRLRERRASGGTSTMREEDLYGPGLEAAIEAYTERSVEVSRHVSPDVVHAHDWMTYAGATRAARHHNVPMLAHIHATELDRTNGCPNPWIFECERRGLREADGIIAVSAFTRDLLVREYGIAASKVTVVHNGHDLEAVPTAPALLSQHGHKRHPLVLFLGRLTIQKNPEQFLATAAAIHRLRPDVQFVMAGTGPMLGTLMEQACALGLGQNMVFAGRVNKREAQALYAAADCFVMPSLSEPFGLVALEAIAHGAPVVLSRQSGASEVLDHSFKVDFWDTDRFADCILTILRETPLARQLRSEAPRILQSLTWRNQARLIQDTYRSAITSLPSSR
jgi:glycosyltransferase involved in cell wall biosynthesis